MCEVVSNHQGTILEVETRKDPPIWRTTLVGIRAYGTSMPARGMLLMMRTEGGKHLRGACDWVGAMNLPADSCNGAQ